MCIVEHGEYVQKLLEFLKSVNCALLIFFIGCWLFFIDFWSPYLVKKIRFLYHIYHKLLFIFDFSYWILTYTNCSYLFFLSIVSFLVPGFGICLGKLILNKHLCTFNLLWCLNCCKIWNLFWSKKWSSDFDFVLIVVCFLDFLSSCIKTND